MASEQLRFFLFFFFNAKIDDTQQFTCTEALYSTISPKFKDFSISFRYQLQFTGSGHFFRSFTPVPPIAKILRIA